MKEKLKPIINFFTCLFEKSEKGRNREVFMVSDKNLVLKVPQNKEGFQDNYHERKTWLRNKKQQVNGCYYGPNFAQCYLFHINNVPILVMEKVEILWNDDIEELFQSEGMEKWGWIHQIDCQQVGKNEDDEVVAFDYGYY